MQTVREEEAPKPVHQEIATMLKIVLPVGLLGGYGWTGASDGAWCCRDWFSSGS